MSRDIDRSQVLKNILTLNPLREDHSWIQGGKRNKDPEPQRTEAAVARKPSPVRQNSYVLSAIRKFESADSSRDAPVAETSAGNSTNAANKVSPPPVEAEPEGPTAAADAAEHLSQNGDKRPGEAVADTVQLNGERPEGGAEVSADVHGEGCDQNGDADNSESHLPAENGPGTSAEESPETSSPEPGTEELKSEEVLEFSPEVTSEVPQEPVLDTVLEAPPQFAGDVTTTSVEAGHPTDEVLKTTVEESVDSSNFQPDDVAVEQSAESAPSSVVIRELNIYDAFDSDAVDESDRPAELDDVLGSDRPAGGAVPETVTEPELSQSEETGEVQPEDTNSTDELQKRWEDLQKLSNHRDVCSFCDRTFDGPVKLTLSQPALTCHPECLKCGACSTVLGELLLPMFLHGQVIHCEGCFFQAVLT